ncbi:nuclease [Candidimonas sp. SYP-B2681]|nr:nuclease [Candidimonas sp. SYP-B2681]
MLIRNAANRLIPRQRGRILALIGTAVMAAFGLFAAVKPDVAAKQTQYGSSVDTPYNLTGRVVRIADGDTFTLLVDGKQLRVRMASIDAPEVTKDSERPGQAQSQASKNALAALIAGKTLTLTCHERDRYDRNVCEVPLGDGTTANQVQVASGMAWANMEGRGKFMRDPKIPELEKQARRAGIGIWQQGAAVSPWVWRYQCWQQQRC